MVQNSIPATEDGANLHHNFSYGAFGEGGRGEGAGYTGRWGGLEVPRAGVLNWHRWFISTSCVWLSKDDLGIEGGTNLYTYGQNNPVKFIDASGRTNTDSVTASIQNAYLRKDIGELEALYFATGALLALELANKLRGQATECLISPANGNTPPPKVYNTETRPPDPKEPVPPKSPLGCRGFLDLCMSFCEKFPSLGGRVSCKLSCVAGYAICVLGQGH